MAVLKIPTSFNIDLEFEVPEFYKRLLALVIDILLEFFYYKIVIEIMNSFDSSGIDSDYDNATIFLLFWLPVLLYHPVMEITMNGQSIGKKIVGIRVVNEIGGRPSISQYLIRWVLRISDVWVILLLFLVIMLPSISHDFETTFAVLAATAFLVTDIVMIVSSKKGQRIGDKLAGTILINTRTRGNIEETVFQEVKADYVPQFPQIMQLSDRDINAIKGILATARKRNDHTMAENAAEKIKSHLQIQSDISPFDFLETLMLDYNYLSSK
jgi:uncharacterized RDD family membrane protein YckC